MESFGDVLRDLLGEVPVRVLADAVHVEQSVVYRWLRNERVPRLDATHITNIAVALQLAAPQRERLRQAQIATLSEPRTRKAEPSRRTHASRSAVDQLLVRSTSPSPPIASRVMRRSQATVSRTSALNGRDAVINCAIDLLAAAPQARGQTEILISVQGRRLFAEMAGREESRAAWQQALNGALARGWHIVQLWRLDRDVGRTLSLVETMLQLVGSGRYHPQYFERYGHLRPPYDVMIVPPDTALLMLSTERDDGVDEALMLRDEQQVALVARHFARLRAHTQPLLQAFTPQVQEVEYTRALADAESEVGGRMVVKNGLSALTYPPSWWRADSHFLRESVRTGLVHRADLPAYQGGLERRWQAFVSGVRDYQYRDVCPASFVEQIGAGEGFVRPEAPYSGFEVAPELRLEHLRHVVEMLRSYPNYQLALLDRREAEMLSVEPAREVVGDHDAFIGVVSRNARGDVVHVDLHVTEGTIVWALREHFENVWERIAERHRARDYVLHRLEEQITLLKQGTGLC